MIPYPSADETAALELGPWAKSGPLLVSASKVLLGQPH